MLTASPPRNARLRFTCLAVVVTGLLSGWLTPVHSQFGVPGITRIEESWELVIDTPDPALVSPQVATAMFPGADETYYCSFVINHKEPVEGATDVTKNLHLHVGKGGSTRTELVGTGVMNTPGEKITWTQVMARDGSNLTFHVAPGTVKSWALVENNPKIKIQDSAPLFTQYDPATSVKKSGILFGTNRVRSLKLVQVRKYVADVLYSTDSTIRVVYEKPS